MTRKEVQEKIANIMDQHEICGRQRCERVAYEILRMFDEEDLLIVNRAAAGVISGRVER